MIQALVFIILLCLFPVFFVATIYLVIGGIAVAAYVWLLFTYPAISLLLLAGGLSLQIYSMIAARKEQALYKGENSRWLARLLNEN